MKTQFLAAAHLVTNFVGTPGAFLGAALLIGAWLEWNHVTGSQRGVDNLNLSISIVSLLLLILLQMSQNRSERTAQLQRSEIIRALETASNDFIAAEAKTDEELEELNAKLPE